MIASSDEFFDMQNELRKFDGRIRRRNCLEWTACVAVVLAFTGIALSSHRPLGVISAAEVVVAAAYVGWRIHRRGRVQLFPNELSSNDSARTALVRELKRQADLTSGVAYWYVAPLFVGWLGLEVDILLRTGFTPLQRTYIPACLGFGVLLVVVNRWGARRLLERAERLENCKG